MNNFPENENSNENRQYLNAIAIILLEIAISIRMIKTLIHLLGFDNAHI